MKNRLGIFGFRTVIRQGGASRDHFLLSRHRVTSMAESARGGVLDSILPALTLAKTSVVGIGIPGVEAVINCVFQLATMVSVRQSTFIATGLRSSP
jgi:hypothetical protein